MTDNQHDIPTMLASQKINESINIVGLKTTTESREGLRFNLKRLGERLGSFDRPLKVARKDCVDTRIL